MRYLTARESGGVLCDLSYFSHKVQCSKPKNGLTIWPWGLDYYRIRMEDIPTSEFLNRLAPLSKILNRLADRRRLVEFCKQRTFHHHFPIAPDTTEELAELLDGSIDDYAVVHVRGCDYHAVASRVYLPEERLRQVFLFRRMLPRTVCFVSDDTFSPSFRDHAEVGLPGATIHYLDKSRVSNQYTAHAIMRNASVLFAANSTFSATAGLLQKPHGLTIMPGQYASDRQASLNSQWREMADFLVL